MTYEDLDNAQEAFHNPLRDQESDYMEEDLDYLFRQDDFNSWEMVLDWLRNYGAKDQVLSPGKVEHLIDDVIRVVDEGHEFTKNAVEAIKITKSVR